MRRVLRCSYDRSFTSKVSPLGVVIGVLVVLGACGDDEAAPGGDATTDAAGDTASDVAGDTTAPTTTATGTGTGGTDAVGDTSGEAPRFVAPAPITLAMGETTTVSLGALLSDAEDADAALVVTWEALHVALSVSLDERSEHVLTVIAPVDWSGVEDIALLATDTDGNIARQTLVVTVEPPDDPDPPKGCPTTFTLAAGVGAESVLLSGSFNTWGSTPETAAVLTDGDGDGTFSVTLDLEPGSYTYKFIVDGTWMVDPGNPKTADDGFGGKNSVRDVPVGCTPPPVSECETVTFTYTASASVTAVFLAGSFNAWSATATPMTDGDGDHVFTATLALDDGEYQYKIVVDGTWLTDPANPDTAPDGFGGNNSVLVVDCPEPGELVLVSHTTDAAARTFAATFTSAEAVAPASVTVTVDQVAVAGAVTASGDGLALFVSGLADGIHDVRVTSGEQTLLLKVYINVSTDWRDALMYFALTDRFANGDPSNDAPVAGVDARTNYQGGDFAGLVDKIDDGYFDDLGVGALWLSWPIDNLDGYEDGTRIDQDGCNLDPKTAASAPMRYTAYHGYWPSDLDGIEEHFGTEAELRALVVKAHARGIRVVLDFTANHVHDSSPLWSQHQGDGWFNTPAQICADIGWDTAPETCWFAGYLPDLDYRNGSVRRALLDHAIGWAKDLGADGFRVDAVKHVNMAFVRDLRSAVRRELELTGIDFYLVGETFTGDTGQIASFVGADKLHGQFDFPTDLSVRKGLATYQIGLGTMDQEVRGHLGAYGAQALMSPFAGNHDLARFISHAAGSLACGIWDETSHSAQGWRNPPSAPGDAAPYEKLRLGLTYVYLVPGVPLLYYGDEIGLPGAGDPDNRRAMRFGVDLSTREADTLAFVQRLGRARRDHAVLSRGALGATLVAESDTLAFVKTLDAERAVVVLHRGGSSRSVNVPVAGAGLADGTALVDVVGTAGNVTVAGGVVALTLPARSAVVLVRP